MMLNKIVIFSLIILILLVKPSFSCTTVIISGKYTKDGRPLLIKHRDTSFEQNKLMYFKDGKYNYIGLVNSADEKGNEVWGGSNSAGFAIMNSASYNLKPWHDKTNIKDLEGIIMKKALQNCASLEDFEALLDSLPKPLGVEANFGVIDAQGGCAYYECNNFEYVKVDANNPSIAPFGYVIRTNYSFNGSSDEGYGYIRYMNAEKLLYQAAAENNLTYRFLLQDLSRSLEHSLTGINLRNLNVEENENRFIPLQDFIVRKSSVSTILVQGVKEGESPNLVTIWTILGFQPASVTIPTWVDGGEILPDCLTADNTGNAPLCSYALELKKKCFPIERGSGYKYMNLSYVYNKQGTGIIQKLHPLENEIISLAEERISNWRDIKHVPKQEALRFYNEVDQSVNNFYKKSLIK